jgi:hypothetical protein
MSMRVCWCSILYAYAACARRQSSTKELNERLFEYMRYASDSTYTCAFCTWGRDVFAAGIDQLA